MHRGHVDLFSRHRAVVAQPPRTCLRCWPRRLAAAYPSLVSAGGLPRTTTPKLAQKGWGKSALQPTTMGETFYPSIPSARNLSKTGCP